LLPSGSRSNLNSFKFKLSLLGPTSARVESRPLIESSFWSVFSLEAVETLQVSVCPGLFVAARDHRPGARSRARCRVQPSAGSDVARMLSQFAYNYVLGMCTSTMYVLLNMRGEVSTPELGQSCQSRCHVFLGRSRQNMYRRAFPVYVKAI